jgi:hypothetical protein
MGEAGTLAWGDALPPSGGTQVGIMRDPAQDQYYAHAGQESPLGLEVRSAALQLDGQGQVVGRGASCRGGDPAIA